MTFVTSPPLSNISDTNDLRTQTQSQGLRRQQKRTASQTLKTASPLRFQDRKSPFGGSCARWQSAAYILVTREASSLMGPGQHGVTYDHLLAEGRPAAVSSLVQTQIFTLPAPARSPPAQFTPLFLTTLLLVSHHWLST